MLALNTVPIGYSDLGYSGRAGYSDLNPNGTSTALSLATSTPVTEASRYIQCALY